MQGQTKEHDDLKTDLAAVDAALADLSKRLEVARDDVTTDVKQQLTSLEKRKDSLEVQLKATATLADAEAEKAHREIHRAIVDLKIDTMQLTNRIPR